MKATELTLRYLAYFVIEADTPLAIGSGEKGFTVDRLIARDALGLPYLPGSSLAGVMRHELDPTDEKEQIKKLFGYQEKNSDKGQGSRLIFSSGHLMGADGQTVIEGLQELNLAEGYYSYFTRLPERDHVRMTHRGAADTAGHGKFDEELVHKGTRFAFRLELIGDDQADEGAWKNILDTIRQPLFRLGAGTRKGFGKLKVISCHTRVFALEQKDDLQSYLNLSSSLNVPLDGWTSKTTTAQVAEGWTHYRVSLTPKDFFLFAAGYGDEEVDNKPKTERYFTWGPDGKGKPELKERDYLLIPATSVKGALSHRVAWHYNRLVGNYIFDKTETAPIPQVEIDEVMASLELPFEIDKLDIPSDSEQWGEYRKQIESADLETLLQASEVWKRYKAELEQYQANYKPDELPVEEKNEAVKALFGYVNESGGKENDGQRGHVVLEDVFLKPEQVTEKIFSHVSIDRFTGGARDGMLFQQKVVSTQEELTLDIYVKSEALKDDKMKLVWEAALNDLCYGDLPLGGSTTKGHGIFKGEFQLLNQPS